MGMVCCMSIFWCRSDNSTCSNISSITLVLLSSSIFVANFQVGATCRASHLNDFSNVYGSGFVVSEIFLFTPKSINRCHSLFIFQLLRSEEHTSELQSRGHLVCRLLLEKK